MDGRRIGTLVLAFVLAGCQGDRVNLSDPRPLTMPAPGNVQAEIRDARFFLPLPDRSIGPMPVFDPRQGVSAPSSR